MNAAHPARPGDLALVDQITAAAYAVYGPLLGGPPVPAIEDYAPRIAAGEVWIVAHAGAPAGVIVLQPAPDHLLIFSIALLPAFQRQGLGRWMLDWIERHATQAGVPELRLYTNAMMERNLALYAQAGYRETGRRPNPVREGWTLVDMAKRVTPAGAVPPGVRHPDVVIKGADTRRDGKANA